MKRIIVEAGRSMLHSRSNIPLFLWAEAMNTAVYVINITGPTRHDNKTPYELWFGKQANIDNLKVFYTKCSVLEPPEMRRKLDKVSQEGYLVGYLDRHKIYRIYIPKLREIIRARDVNFKPEELSASTISIKLKSISNDPKENFIINEEHNNAICNDLDQNDCMRTECDVNSMENSENHNDDIPMQEGRQLRDRSKIRPTDFYGCPVTFFTQKIPMSYEEAMS